LTEIAANNALGPMMASAAVVKTPTTETTGSCDSLTVPFISDTLVEGRKVISGCAGTKDKSVSVVVIVNPPNGGTEPPAECPNPLPRVTPVPVTLDSTGAFSAELKSALRAGDSVCVWQVSGHNVLNYSVRRTIVSKWAYTQSDTERGHTRYYLSTGVALSEDNQQFSNQDIYVGFDLERNWLRGRHSFLNSDFSAQLTSIPTAATSTPSTSSSSSTTPSVSTFISSRKAAVVSGDFYAPLYAESFKWWYDGGSTMFVAPIVKGGLQTITSGALSITSPAPGTSTTTTTVNNQGLYYLDPAHSDV